MMIFWLAPLVLMAGIAGLLIGIGTVILRRRRTGRWFDGPATIALFAAPVGCVALPLAALFALSLYARWAQASDAQLYEEVFGYAPTIAEDAMIFDDFGSGASRAIYMRADVTQAQRMRVLSIAVLRPSRLTVANVDSAGEARGFIWWEAEGCGDPMVYSADGYRGWASLTLLDCPSQQRIYAIALRTVDE